jgi:hypothetical protein
VIVKGSEFIPPPDGVQDAVCVDVVDLGMVEGHWGTKHKIKIVWELDALKDDGTRHQVSKRYTASLHELSNLAKDLKSWRGKPFTPDELKGFDTEKIVGVPCQLVIVHTDKEGMVYGDVTTVIRANGRRTAPSGSYQRVKDRPAATNGHAAHGHHNGHKADDSDIPF